MIRKESISEIPLDVDISEYGKTVPGITRYYVFGLLVYTRRHSLVIRKGDSIELQEKANLGIF